MLSYCLGRVCLEVAVAIGRELLRPLSPPIDRAERDDKNESKHNTCHGLLHWQNISFNIGSGRTPYCVCIPWGLYLGSECIMWK